MTSLLLSVSGVFSYIGYILLALGALLFLVMVHELGHYTAGKILGFKINEFSIGFGPKIFQKKKKNGELFTLRVIPLGGYCAFDGEDEDGDSPTAFNKQKPWKRLIVLVSGVLFNFLVAVLCSFFLLTCFGYEKVEVSHINSNSINHEILYEGDIIYGIDGTEFDFVKDNYFSLLLSEYSNSADFKASEFMVDGSTYREIPMNIKRGKEEIVVNVRLKMFEVDGEEVWSFLSDIDSTSDFDFENAKSTIWEALGECWTFSFRWSYKILIILGDLFTGGIPIKDLGGPVTTIKVMADTTQQSISSLFILLPVIAVNLAVFNILPIPSLDGARMVFVAIEWVRGKPIKREIEGRIHAIGLMLLFGFVILVDVLHFVL